MPYQTFDIENNLPVKPVHILQIIDSLQFGSASIDIARAGRTNFGASAFTSSAQTEFHSYGGNDPITVYGATTNTKVLTVTSAGNVVITGSIATSGSISLSATGSFILPTTASATPTTGQVYFDFTSNKLYAYNGAAWVTASLG